MDAQRIGQEEFLRRPLPLGLIALLVCTATATAADRDDIRSLENRMTKVFIDKDWKALATFYAADAVLMPPNVPEVRGNQEIASFFAGSPLTISDFKVSSEDLQVNGRSATNRGTYSLTFTVPGVTTPMTDDGKYLWVLRKSPEGKWRIAIDMFSSNHPPPPAK
jgi:ketosteroid isomerase-like protein